MNSHCAPNLTRRLMLASCGGITVAVVVGRAAAADEESSDTGRRPTKKISQVREEFERLLPLWQEERKQYGMSSNTYDYWKGPHGKAIIALGPAIIPYLIQQLKTGDFWFNVPLTLITKVDIANGNLNSEQANSRLWMEWWEAAKK